MRPCSEAKRLIGRPQEALLCAKAKRQQQSAQQERKSTTRYDDKQKKQMRLPSLNNICYTSIKLNSIN